MLWYVVSNSKASVMYRLNALGGLEPRREETLGLGRALLSVHSHSNTFV